MPAAGMAVWTMLVLAQAGTAPGRYAVPAAFEAAGSGTGEYRCVLGGSVVTVSGDGISAKPAGGGAGDAIRARFDGAPGSARVEPVERLKGVSNYFLGSDPAGWRTGVARYRGVRVRRVYPGVDLTVMIAGGKVEYNWEIEPGGEIGRIGLAFEAGTRMRVHGDGALVAERGGFRLVEKRPESYQDEPGERRHVRVDYALRGSNVAGLRVGRYDRGRELVVDPVLEFVVTTGGSGSVAVGSESGGNRNDQGNAVTTDAQGNVYVAGTSYSTDFPVTAGAAQASGVGNGIGTGFVMKLDPTGSEVLFATYFGGQGGSGGSAVAVAASGHVYVGGYAGNGAPLVNPLASAYAPCSGTSCGYGYLAELSGDGSALLFATFVGGGKDSLSGIAILAPENVAFGGTTFSGALPATRGAFQTGLSAAKCTGCSAGFAGLITSTPAGRGLAFLSYLGGSGNDTLAAVATDASGSVYAAGTTISADFPVTSGAYENTFESGPNGGSGFMSKFDPTGSRLAYSTYIGGVGGATLSALAVDGETAYAAGEAYTAAFPITPGTYQGSGSGGAAVVALSAGGSSLLFSSVVGPGSATAIAVANGEVWLTGPTTSAAFPLRNPIQGGTYSRMCAIPVSGSFGPCLDGFVLEMSADGRSLQFATYLGADQGTMPLGIALDPAGNAVVVGATGGLETLAKPLPGTKQGTVFLAKIAPQGVTPYFSYQSTTNAIGYVSAPISPGELLTIFGKNFAAPGIVTADRLPLPLSLGGVSVTVNGVAAPVLAVANVNGQEQINIQVPYDFTTGTPNAAAIVVTTPLYGKSVPTWVEVEPTQQVGGEYPISGTPGIVTTDGVHAAVQHGADFSPVTASSPARSGETLVLYATGLGPVLPAVASGTAAPASPPAVTVIPPGVTVGGVAARVVFAGLAPGFVGLYQVNFQLGAATPAGDVRLAVNSGAGTSNAVTMFVGN